MKIYIGEVETFPNAKASKAQALKVLEESAEVFAAWQDLPCNCPYECEPGTMCELKLALVNECADVIQAVCNMLAGLEIDDFSYYMELCRLRNQGRGRYQVYGFDHESKISLTPFNVLCDKLKESGECDCSCDQIGYCDEVWNLYNYTKKGGEA